MIKSLQLTLTKFSLTDNNLCNPTHTSHFLHTMSHFLLFFFFSLLPALPALPNPDPLQSFNPTQPNSTIPSFPETQSQIPGCPLLHLPSPSPALRSSCFGSHITRSECCPVLATWLYSAYSDTALQQGRLFGRTGLENVGDKSVVQHNRTTLSSLDEMPMLPDDTERCGTGLEKEMRERGVVLSKVNESCDVVSCFCGIRIHPLSCPDVFRVNEVGRLVGDGRVSRLERDCGVYANFTHHHHSKNLVARCSKCLHSLYSLKSGASGSENATKLEARTSKMHSRDCELMGLTWLLNKDRDLYISTVTAVMRALMLNSEDADPPSCSLSSNGMPLAVDSAEINDQSSSSIGLKFSFNLFLIFMSPNLLWY